MSQGRKILLWTGTSLFIFMLASLLMMSQSLQNSELFDRYYSLLLIFNAIALISLVILILLNIKRLLRQLKHQVVGSRLMLRMVIIFSLLSVTPVLIVYYFSLDFLHRGIDSWFDLRVEQALDDSLELSRLALDVRMRELLHSTEQIADEIAEYNDAALPFEIDQIRERINANELTLLTRTGGIIATSLSDTSSLVPNTPDEATLLQVLQGSSYINLDIIKNAGLLIRVVVNSTPLDIQQEPRIIHALFPISERMNQLTNNVQSSYIEYKELSYLREQLKVSFIIILTLVLLFSIFSAVWAAFYSASNLAAPVKNLAKGTRAIAEGNYNTKLPVPGNDELGFLVASFNDMTDKISEARDNVKQSQLEAESQHSYLETVLSRLSSGVLVFNTDGQLQRTNISASQILQSEFDNHIHDDIGLIVESYPSLENFFQPISNNIKEQLDDWREQITLSDKTGDSIIIMSGTTLSDAEGIVTGHVIVFDEITALIKGQRDAAWKEMARRLAHEIKNPLTPIQLAAERLRHKYLPSMEAKDADTLDRMTNTIVQQVDTMKDMVNNFSDYARAPEFEPKQIDIQSLVQEVCDLFSNLDHGNQIVTDIETDLPLISGDEKKLRQVFNNLLSNAVDANTMENDNYLKVTINKLNEKDNILIEIRVIDKGPGIGDDVANKLFEPYMTTKQKGTGLGLAIVKRIIDEHEGNVWLENNSEHKGTSAVVQLPLKQSLVINEAT